MEKEINKYLDYLRKQKNYSENTVQSYNEDLNLFLSYLNKELIDYKKIDYSLLRGFFHELDDRKLSNTTISRIISSLRMFYRYLVLEKRIENNPFLLVKSPKKEKKLPKFLYPNEIEALLSINDDTPLGVRNHTIILLLYSTGIRVSELVNIKLCDLDFSSFCIKILGKGNKERYVYFLENTKKQLLDYIKSARIKLVKKNNPYLFLNNNGEKLTTTGIRYILDKMITNASLKIKISPHVIRHTFATHLLNNGCDITSVQLLLGHESLKATQIYTHVTNEHLKEVYLNTHPRSIDKE